jgi:hypothetical protein
VHPIRPHQHLALLNRAVRQLDCNALLVVPNGLYATIPTNRSCGQAEAQQAQEIGPTYAARPCVGAPEGVLVDCKEKTAALVAVLTPPHW